MHGRARRRSNIFKLGRRGRRGRVPFSVRWGPISTRGLNAVDNNSVHARSMGDEASPSQACGEAVSPAPNEATIDDVVKAVNEEHRNADLNTPPALHSSVIKGPQDMEMEQLASSMEVHENTLSSRDPDIAASRELYVGSNETQNLSGSAGVARTYPVRTHCNEDIITPAVGCAVADNQHTGDGIDLANAEFEFEFEDERLPTVGHEEVQQNDGGNGDGVLVPGATVQNDTTAPSPLQFRDGQYQDGHTWSPNDISTAFRKISTWQNLLSVVVVTGSVRLSVREYELFRTCMNTLLKKGFPQEQLLPAYSTVSRTLLPLARSWCFAHSATCTTEVDVMKAGARQETGLFRVVKPSTWSAMDVSCPQTWKILKNASQEAFTTNSRSCFDVIETTPMLRCRETVLSFLPGMVAPISHDQECRNLTTPSQSDCQWSIVLRTSSMNPIELSRLLNASLQEGVETSTLVMSPLETSLVTKSARNGNLGTADPRALALGVLPHLRTEIEDLWESGDYCTSLRPKDDVPYVFVLVHHQPRPGRVSRPIDLVSIPYQVRRTMSGDCCFLQWARSHRVRVSSVTVTMQGIASPEPGLRPNQPGSPTVPAYGRLRNGQRYFVDSILLYSDGFTQYRFKQGSAGGVYCLSLNYPPALRRSRERVRVLALTPPGVCTKEGIRAVMNDLVRTSIEGVMVRNADGENMLLFTDVVGYVCDYCEVGHVLDVVGHKGRAPCHLCSFLRYNGHETTGSQYGNTTINNTANACYARSGPRTEAMRDSDISEKDLVALGLKNREDARKQRSPLFEFCKLLREKVRTANIPLTECNRPVVSPSFDAYRSVLVAPDHLLAGIAINELTLAFKALPTRARRVQADTLICKQLQRNGLLQ